MSRAAIGIGIGSALVLGACDQTTSTPEPAAATTTTTTSSDEPTEPFAKGFVDAHDLHRSKVSPPAKPPLPPVRWSPEIAAQAQAWAQRCEFEHGDTDLGENLSARTDVAEPSEIVAGWAAEGEAYDYASNRCESGKVCGHYTQVVWRNSTQIGCGMAQCNSGGPWDGPWVMWVCRYSPAGNWQGKRPY